MKRIITLILICMIGLFSVSAAYANDTKEKGLTVTSGLDFEKERISTFDSSRTVSGSAQKDGHITIEVFSVKDGDMKLYSSYDISVGISGIFAQSIEFGVGESYVVITDETSGESKGIVINRKSRDIKRALEEGIYLP